MTQFIGKTQAVIHTETFSTVYVDAISPDGISRLNFFNVRSSIGLSVVGIWMLWNKDIPFETILGGGVAIFLIGMCLLAVNAQTSTPVIFTHGFIELEDKNRRKKFLDFNEPHSFVSFDHPRAKDEEKEDQQNKSAIPVPRIYRNSYILICIHTSGWHEITESHGFVDTQKALAVLSGLDDFIHRKRIKYQESYKKKNPFWKADESGDY